MNLFDATSRANTATCRREGVGLWGVKVKIIVDQGPRL